MKTVNDVTILFVDDEPDLLNSLRRFLRKASYQTLFSGTGDEAMKIMDAQPVDIVVSDLRMPGMDGLTLLSKVKARHPEVIRLILSATRDVEQTIEAINTGEVYRFISKPLDPEPFKRIIRDTVDYHLLKIERHETMAEIEKRLLQSNPPQCLSGATISSLMIPAAHLAGDFAEYFVYDDSHLDILIGDVMGKGIQSALVGASIKQLFSKSLALHDCVVTPRVSCPNLNYYISKIDLVMSGVHDMCIESLMELEMFATLCYVRLDLEIGKMGIVDCGHLPTIHYQFKKKGCTFIKGDNHPLGFVSHQNYKVITTDIKQGDLLLFYSDGVTEAHSPSGEMFELERLADIVAKYHHLPPEDLLEIIRVEVAAFSGSERFNDDFTCVAVCIE